MNTSIVNRKDMTGKIFSGIFVEGFAYRGHQNRAFWNCKCGCGKSIIVSGTKLRNGHTRSCGCRRSRSLTGSRHPNWRGGVTSINRRLRNTKRYKEWRSSVFLRDNYTCVCCGHRGYLNADHIKPFSSFPSLRFEISNGRTLCIPCHRKTNTYGGRTHYAK